MKVGVRIKGDEIIVLKHNDDIIEENVETIVIITKENNAGEPAECGSVIYKEQDIEFKEVPLYTKDTFAFLMENHFISHSYMGTHKRWLLHHLIQYKRDLPYELLDYVCFESGESYDLSGSLSLVENLSTAKWLINHGVSPVECSGYPNAYLVWQRNRNKEIIDYMNSVKPVTANPFWNYLELLRRSGVTNMYGATPYLTKKFSINHEEAANILCDWMSNYNRSDYEKLENPEDLVSYVI